MSLFLFIIYLSFLKSHCTCVPLAAIDDKQYNQYNLIVKGKIVRMTMNEFSKTIYLAVDTLYKGQEQHKTIKISSPSSAGVCGIFPKVGEHWLVFAYTDEANYKTDLCTRTKNMNPKAWDYKKDELDNDLKFLTGKLK